MRMTEKGTNTAYKRAGTLCAASNSLSQKDTSSSNSFLRSCCVFPPVSVVIIATAGPIPSSPVSTSSSFSVRRYHADFFVHFRSGGPSFFLSTPTTGQQRPALGEHQTPVRRLSTRARPTNSIGVLVFHLPLSSTLLLTCIDCLRLGSTQPGTPYPFLLLISVPHSSAKYPQEHSTHAHRNPRTQNVEGPALTQR